MSSRVRIVLAERHLLFREAIVTALESEEAMVVEASVCEGRHAVEECVQRAPDLALLGASIRNCDVYTAADLVKRQVPSCRVVILGGEADNGALVQAVEAGVSAYLPRASTLAEVVASIHAVYRGEVLIPPEMLGPLLSSLTGRRREREDVLRVTSALTRRECEVLVLLAGAADNETIAGALFISPQTARTHIQNILSKLGVHSRLEAAALVNRSGILADLAGRCSDGVVAGRAPDLMLAARAAGTGRGPTMSGRSR